MMCPRTDGRHSRDQEMHVHGLMHPYATTYLNLQVAKDHVPTWGCSAAPASRTTHASLNEGGGVDDFTRRAPPSIRPPMIYAPAWRIRRCTTEQLACNRCPECIS